tara:strand:+ start:465 stop:701 length:237 start_codon:yes stop_codon:yes gene_type:complete
MLGTGKTYRSRVEAIAESGSLVETTGNLFFATFNASSVDNLTNEDCVDFIMSMDTIGCHCCSYESELAVEALVYKATR